MPFLFHHQWSMIIIAIAISRFADHHHFCATNNCGRSHYSIRFLFLLLLHSKLLCSVFFLCLSSLLFINCGIIMIFHWNETKWNETKRDKKNWTTSNGKNWNEIVLKYRWFLFDCCGTDNEQEWIGLSERKRKREREMV